MIFCHSYKFSENMLYIFQELSSIILGNQSESQQRTMFLFKFLWKETVFLEDSLDSEYDESATFS